jgi:hypothetical protein
MRKSQRTHAPRRGSAWGRGVWTLVGASVECRVMSGATAAGADEACCAEQRDSAAWREPRSALSEIALRHYGFLLARIRLTRTAAERGPVLSGACGQVNGFHSLVCTCLPCASPGSEHGILGKRRVKLKSPAVGRTPRGCQPDEQFRPRLSGTLWSAAVRVRGSRAQRRGRWTAQFTSPAPRKWGQW